MICWLMHILYINIGYKKFKDNTSVTFMFFFVFMVPFRYSSIIPIISENQGYVSNHKRFLCE